MYASNLARIVPQNCKLSKPRERSQRYSRTCPQGGRRAHQSLRVYATAGVNRQWILKKRPEGSVHTGDLELTDAPIPTPGDGEVLVRNTYVSIDPTHRIWMSDMPQYMPCVELGEVMRAITVGVVEESNFDGLEKGDIVGGLGNCQDYYVSEGAGLDKKTTSVPVQDHLNVFGVVIGLTAFYGTMKICQPKAGETFVVTGAAGAVGSLAGQLAKMAGARVIGAVGSQEKADYITKELGFDGAINYKTDDLDEKLKELAPDGVDCFFDNTAGPMLEAVLLQLNNNSRIALCGLINQYNTDKVGVKNYDMLLMRRVTLRGFICLDHIEYFGEALEMLGAGVAEGKIKYKTDVQEGLPNYIDVVNMLFDGSNDGKLVLKV
ncbi:hypothetical protein CYMTET_55682 [Cymbomonas tetramitiformis]|uniref:Enoyl reductase (ER) domain-containing protein n=1 Tax=Cymbomonas tetramitiformis TaxID=36881 RepID=A0AAE0BDQ0_9CHLO|nr:hypothetical protein CYMTET_55682 [Cymbomonas tetramitiformis]|eukprot:gene5838-7036_t